MLKSVTNYSRDLWHPFSAKVWGYNWETLSHFSLGKHTARSPAGSQTCPTLLISVYPECYSSSQKYCSTSSVCALRTNRKAWAFLYGNQGFFLSFFSFFFGVLCKLELWRAGPTFSFHTLNARAYPVEFF